MSESAHNGSSHSVSSTGPKDREEEPHVTDKNAHLFTHLTRLTPGPELTDTGLAQLTKLTELNISDNKRSCTIPALLSLPDLKIVTLSATPSRNYVKGDVKALQQKGITIRNPIVEDLLAKWEHKEGLAKSKR